MLYMFYMFVELIKWFYVCRKDNSYQKSGGGGARQTVFVKGFDRSLDEDSVLVYQYFLLKSYLSHFSCDQLLPLSFFIIFRSEAN